MDYKLLDEQGSFKAWGVGFHYEYDAEFRILDIIHARTLRPVTYIDVDQSIGLHALLYVRILNKSIQVNALSYSNNTSIDLSDIWDINTLPAILERTAYRARHALYLQQRQLRTFTKSYNERLKGGSVSIKPIKQSIHSQPFYVAHFQTHNGTVATVRNNDLHSTLSRLSDAIVDDIAVKEFLVFPKTNAQQLLHIASDVFMLSCILNNDFYPCKFTATGQVSADKRGQIV